jgi:hypothetical protein
MVQATVRLCWKWLIVTNNLAYYGMKIFTAKMDTNLFDLNWCDSSPISQVIAHPCLKFAARLGARVTRNMEKSPNFFKNSQDKQNNAKIQTNYVLKKLI